LKGLLTAVPSVSFSALWRASPVRCFRAAGTRRRLGFPRFKKRGRCRDSFRLTGTLRCGRGTVTLPRLGTVRTFESARKLARHSRPGTAIGIDLGVKALLTGADDAGSVLAVPGPRPLAAGLRRLRRASLHARIADVRTDALHKATSMLAARYETVVAEDLLKLAASGAERKNARGGTVRPSPAGRVPAAA
jgi:putative transposase